MKFDDKLCVNCWHIRPPVGAMNIEYSTCASPHLNYKSPVTGETVLHPTPCAVERSAGHCGIAALAWHPSALYLGKLTKPKG